MLNGVVALHLDASCEHCLSRNNSDQNHTGALVSTWHNNHSDCVMSSSLSKKHKLKLLHRSCSPEEHQPRAKCDWFSLVGHCCSLFRLGGERGIFCSEGEGPV